MITACGADGADDRSVGCRVGEGESRILHREDLDAHGHLPLTARRRQAAKQTRVDLLNLTGFVTNHHTCVSSSKAISCEDEGGFSSQTSHDRAQVCLGIAPQRKTARRLAFPPHNHPDIVLTCGQSAYPECDDVISYRSDLQLKDTGENCHTVHLAAKSSSRDGYTGYIAVGAVGRNAGDGGSDGGWVQEGAVGVTGASDPADLEDDITGARLRRRSVTDNVGVIDWHDGARHTCYSHKSRRETRTADVEPGVASRAANRRHNWVDHRQKHKTAVDFSQHGDDGVAQVADSDIHGERDANESSAVCAEAAVDPCVRAADHLAALTSHCHLRHRERHRVKRNKLGHFTWSPKLTNDITTVSMAPGRCKILPFLKMCI